MLTEIARPRVLLPPVVVLVLATAGWMLWRTNLPLRKSSAEIANSYLPDRADLEVKPGANAEAYALYLRARELETQESGQSLHAAQDLYQEAIAADRTLALAHARLAVVLAKIGASPGDQEKAQSSAKEALRLDPKLGDAHFARALLFAGDEQYADAVPEVELAIANRPDDSEIVYLAASLHRRQGKWRQSLTEFKKAVALSPRNFNGPTDLAYHSSLMRDWAVAVPAWDRALAIVPEYMFNRICRAYVDFWAKGDLNRGNALLASFSAEYAGQSKEFLAWMRWDFNLLQRDFASAEKSLDDYKDDPITSGFFGPLPKSYMRGCIELAKNNPGAAKPLFAESCKFFEQRVEKNPKRPARHAQLALAYAFMGRKDDALREGVLATELCPESKDAFDGTLMATGLAVVYARTGETDKAIVQIERLLRTPGALNYDNSITLNDLKLRWQWDPLRFDPRFQAIVNGPEPATIIR